jgi:two-component system phosphate regulon sensor histidine kinase PhoR
MSNRVIFRLIIFGALAIVSIMATQAYLLINTWSSEEKVFNENVMIALQNVAKEFEKLGSALPNYNIVNQVSSNYFVVDINDFIDANNLEFFLKRELEEIGLREDFEYGIYNCDTKKMAYGKYISYKDPNSTVPNHTPEKLLPVHDKFLYYFGVRFPNRTSQILSGMRLSIIFSLILLITISFFLFSLFIILRQKRLSEMQKDFINNMTHEFKTPISTIKISSEVFLNSPEISNNKRLLQYATIISEQNNRLNKQVEKVLQLAKIEKDNFRLNLENVDLNELLEKILASISFQIEDAGGNLSKDLCKESSMILADKLHLTNIIHNILDNAIKYCKGSPEITVKTRINRDKKLRLIIEDKGLGIDSEHLNRIYEKFFRVPTGNIHDVKGFGLGLFYTKNICDAHKWKIAIHSKIGNGTTVEIIM